MEKQQHREIHVPRAQLDLDLKSSRTREEIIRNIKEKRKVGLPLDEEEIAEMEYKKCKYYYTNSAIFDTSGR